MKKIVIVLLIIAPPIFGSPWEYFFKIISHRRVMRTALLLENKYFNNQIKNSLPAPLKKPEVPNYKQLPDHKKADQNKK